MAMEEKPVIALYTIGFTKKSAEEFFTKLHEARIKRVVDIRLNNVSQLAGFAKKEDLRFFLRVVGGIDYLHLPLLAPTQELLDGYKKHKGDWTTYEKGFLNLISSRRIEETVSKELMDGACLLCSEEEPGRCHRRLVAEYLRDQWADVVVNITHLV